jgi:hypothetical protein
VVCALKADSKAGDKKSAGNAFKISEPSSFKVPAGQSHYVTIDFTPEQPVSFAAQFTATVDKNSDAASGLLTFALTGSGTVPVVAIDKDGTHAFGEVNVGATRELSFVLKNDGSVSTPCRVDLDTDVDSFELVGGGRRILEAGVKHQLLLRFCPKSAGSFESGIKLTDAGNESKRVLIIKGTGCNDPVRWVDNNKPGEKIVDVDIGQVPIGSQATYSIDLQNQTKYTSRFVIDVAALAKVGIKVSPTTGHVLSRRSKKIQLSIKPEAEVAAAKIALPVKITDIALVNESLFKLGWDSARAEPEPEYEMIPKTERPLPLTLSVKSGQRQFKCSQTTAIVFDPTMMFQSSTKSFNLSNTGKISFPFKIEVTGGDLSRFFVVQPVTGDLNPGENREITVRFAPLEIYDYSRCGVVLTVLGCAQPPLTLAFSAKAVRPVVHVSLPVTQGQQRVVEFDALGLGMLTRKSFQILNPTAEGFKYGWEGFDANSLFKVTTKSADVAGGKKVDVEMSFTPTSFEPTETDVTLTITGKKIALPFKLIGRASEPRLFTDYPCINFGKRLINNLAVSATFHITSKEDVPFTYSIDLGPHALEEGLHVRPVKGVIEAHGKVPVTVKFKLHDERTYNFNLAIHVKWRKLPLYVNVKCEGLRTSPNN